MKEIIVISGKGGTGKTSITAGLATVAGKDFVLADCDVDAADLHILLKPETIIKEDFFSGQLAEINQDLCTKCAKCFMVCRFGAVKRKNNTFTISKVDCEGCAYCAHVCPAMAINMIDSKAGDFFISKTRYKSPMVHAKLSIGAENSGKLVTKVRQEAKKVAKKYGLNYILVDGSPGIGCPVIASITGATYILIITEPSLSGLHDLERLHTLIKGFNLSVGVVINKADINSKITKKIHAFLKKNSIEHLVNFQYHDDFVKSQINLKTIAETGNKSIIDGLETIWNHIKYL